jgi:pyruvate-formate lyase-activating enzyme
LTKALIDVSGGCNTDCVFCLRNLTRARQPVPGAPDFEALQSFLELARELGLSRLEIGGDEPTMLGDETLSSIAERARDRGFSEIALVSNGVELRREAFVRRLVRSGIGLFHLPLYGPSAEIHDAVTQRDGSFDAVRAAARALSELPQAKAVFHTVVLRQNERHLGEIERLAGDWGWPLGVRELYRLSPDPDYEALAPSLPPQDGSVRAPAHREADPVGLHYNLLSGRIQWSTSRGESTAGFVSEAFRKLGAPAGVLEDLERKPAFRDPRRLARLLALARDKDFDSFEFRLARCGTARAALEAGAREFADGRRPEARRLFLEALSFDADDDSSSRAKERATRLLEMMEGKTRPLAPAPEAATIAPGALLSRLLDLTWEALSSGRGVLVPHARVEHEAADALVAPLRGRKVGSPELLGVFDDLLCRFLLEKETSLEADPSDRSGRARELEKLLAPFRAYRKELRFRIEAGTTPERRLELERRLRLKACDRIRLCFRSPDGRPKEIPEETLRRAIDLLFTSSAGLLQVYLPDYEPGIEEAWSRIIGYAGGLARARGKRMMYIHCYLGACPTPEALEPFRRDESLHVFHRQVPSEAMRRLPIDALNHRVRAYAHGPSGLFDEFKWWVDAGYSKIQTSYNPQRPWRADDISTLLSELDRIADLSATRPELRHVNLELGACRVSEPLVLLDQLSVDAEGRLFLADNLAPYSAAWPVDEALLAGSVRKAGDIDGMLRTRFEVFDQLAKKRTDSPEKHRGMLLGAVRAGRAVAGWAAERGPR